jgi:hypothetical protein
MAAAQCDSFLLELSRGVSLMARNCVKIHHLCQFNFMSHQNFCSDTCNNWEHTHTHSLTVCVFQTPLWTCFLSAGLALPEHCSAAAKVSPLCQPHPLDIPTLNKNITTYIQFWNLQKLSRSDFIWTMKFSCYLLHRLTSINSTSRCQCQFINTNEMWFEVLMAVKMLMLVFWVVIPCRLICRHQCYGAFCLQHHSLLQPWR